MQTESSPLEKKNPIKTKLVMEKSYEMTDKYFFV